MIKENSVCLQQQKMKTDQCAENLLVKPMPRARDERLRPILQIQRWRARREVGALPENALCPTARDKNAATPYSMYVKNGKRAQLFHSGRGRHKCGH